MAKDGDYKEITVETFRAESTSGKHGPIHVRPTRGEFYPQSLAVECSKRLTKDYPVGTRFRIRVKLTDREGGGEYLYSYFGWPFDVVRD